MKLTLTEQAIRDWIDELGDTLLERGDRGEQVRTLQSLLIDNRATMVGKADGVFGGLTEQTVRRWQRERSLYDVDGECGELTREDLLAAWLDGWKLGSAEGFRWPHRESAVVVLGGFHPRFGPLRYTSGKCSSFGGPDDRGDRCYGQALVPVRPATVEVLRRKWPELFELGIFRADVDDPLPEVDDYRGGPCTAGISWCLDPESYYCAMLWPSGQSRPDPRHARIGVHFDGRTVAVAPTDYGPHPKTKRVIDLSPGSMAALGAKTDDVVRLAWLPDDTPLGLVKGC